MMELTKPTLILVNTLEIVSAMARLVHLDQPYLDAYFAQWFRTANSASETSSLHVRKAIRVMAELSAKGVFNLQRNLKVWVEFAQGLTAGRAGQEFRTILGVEATGDAASTDGNTQEFKTFN